MKWQDVKNILIGMTSIGVIGLFSALFLLTGVDYTYTEDSVCNGLECTAYINVTTSYWRVCFADYTDTKYENETLFKKQTRSRTLHVNLNKIDNVIKTEPEIPVDWLVPTYGNKWRPLKDGDCWDRLKVNKIKLVGHPKEGQVIKWTIDLDKVQIDPIWVSYNYIYENLSKEVNVYEYNTIEVKPVYNEKNSTWSDAYNYTERTLVGTKTEYYDGKRLGVKAGDTTYLGKVNIEDNYLAEWNVPIGDRNFEEYGRCREYEKKLGVCNELDLLKVATLER